MCIFDEFAYFAPKSDLHCTLASCCLIVINTTAYMDKMCPSGHKSTIELLVEHGVCLWHTHLHTLFFLYFFVNSTVAKVY